MALDASRKACYTGTVQYAILVFFLLWLLVVWAGVLYVLRLGWRAYKKDYREPAERVPATVVDKSEDTTFIPQTQLCERVHQLVFRCRDGRVVAFDVPEWLYRRVSTGDEGLLVRQGGRFIAFEGPSGASETEEDLYRRLVRG